MDRHLLRVFVFISSFLVVQQNLSESADSMLFQYNGQTIAECQSNEFQLEFTSNCTMKCPGFAPFLFANVCLSFCPNGYEATTSGSCSKKVQVTAAPDHENVDINLICQKGFCPKARPFCLDYQCHTTCPFGTVIEDFSCVYTCSKLNPFIFNNTCVADCPKTYPFIEVNQCVENCSTGHVLSESKCIKTCPQGKYRTSASCVDSCLLENKYELTVWNTSLCLDKCPIFTNTNESKCHMQCPRELSFLWNMSCVQKCPKYAPFVYVLSRRLPPYKTPVCLPYCPELTYTDGNVCVHRCISSMQIFNWTCVKECPEKHKFTYQKNCFSACPTNSFIFNDTTCLQNCPINAKYVFNMTCMKSCPSGYKVLNDECVDVCPSNHYIFGGECFPLCRYPYVNFQGSCLFSCPSNLLKYNNTCVEKCPDSSRFSFQQRCVASCLYDDYGYNDSCVFTCPSQAPYIYNKTCHHKCPSTHTLHFVDTSTLRNGQNQVYCVDTCKHTGEQSEKLEFNMSCVDACPSQAPYIYNKTCHHKCPSTHTLHFVDTSTLRNGQNQVYCVDTCENTKQSEKLEFNMSCVDACPSQAPYIYNKTCHHKCPSTHTLHFVDTSTLRNGQNQVYCVDTCKHTGEQSEKLEFNMSCVDACPSQAPYIYNKTCHHKCPSTHTLHFVDTSTLRNGQNSVYCVDTCKHTGEQSEKLEFNMSCVDACPSQAPYIYNKTCHHKCPSTHALHFVDTSTLRNGQNPVYCVDTCKHTGEQSEKLEFNMSCVDACPLLMSNFNGTCVDECPLTHRFAYTAKAGSLNGFKCVSSCKEYGQFSLDDQCVDRCPILSHNFTCVTRCPVSNGFIYNEEVDGTFLQYCVSRCPENTYMLENKCYNECPHPLASFFGNRSCLHRCPSSHKFRFLYNAYPKLKDLFRCEKTCFKPRYIFEDQCIPKCPKSHPYSIGQTCVHKCDAIHKFLDPQTKMCMLNCTQPNVILNNTCVQTCPSGLRFLVNNECTKECPKGMELASPLSRATICGSTCEDSFVQENNTCVSSCSKHNAIVNNICINSFSCPHEYSFFEQSHKGKICRKTCLNSQFIKNFECVTKCESYFVNKECVEKCPATHPFTETLFNYGGTECYSKCPASRFTDGLKCVVLCSSLLYTEDNTCVHQCPPSYPLRSEILTIVCVKECTDLGMVYNKSCMLKSQCYESNDLFVYDNQCVNQCPVNTVLDMTKKHCISLTAGSLIVAPILMVISAALLGCICLVIRSKSSGSKTNNVTDTGNLLEDVICEHNVALDINDEISHSGTSSERYGSETGNDDGVSVHGSIEGSDIPMVQFHRQMEPSTTSSDQLGDIYAGEMHINENTEAKSLYDETRC